MQRDFVRLSLNGKLVDVKGPEAFLPLAQWLRYQQQLPGTKVVCAEGDCGACTVLISHFRNNQWTPFKSINSCISPVYLQDLSCIVTVEGLQEQKDLCTVQQKMVEFHGGQCGYCTPGMVCAIASLAEDCKNSGKLITEKKARNYLTGNLCRCTGYEPILAAAQHLDLAQWTTLAQRYLTSELHDAIVNLAQTAVAITSENKTVQLPTSLQQALELKSANPQIRILSGATDLGVVANKGKLFLDQVMSLTHISELYQTQNGPGTLQIGAMVTLSTVQKLVKKTLPELSRLLDVFASPQIKNQGTLVGNIINGSPIGDTIPPLLVLEAELELCSVRGKRKVSITHFYKAYKVMDIMPDEICTAIVIPLINQNTISRFFKVSMRKDLDISAVTFAALMSLNKTKIVEARIAMGGVGPTVVRLPILEQQMINQDFSESLFEKLGLEVQKQIQPIADLRASKEYRLELAKNLFKKLYFETQDEVKS